jgi:hypothetical protein
MFVVCPVCGNVRCFEVVDAIYSVSSRIHAVLQVWRGFEGRFGLISSIGADEKYNYQVIS